MTSKFILTLSCQDTIGIVAEVAGFLRDNQFNIVKSAQFFDDQTGRFFMRTVFERKEPVIQDDLEPEFADNVADKFGMDWHLQNAHYKPKVLLMVSKFDHCLQTLLHRHKAGSIPMEVVAVISNHPNLQPLANFYQIPFLYYPITKATKPEQEAQIYDFILKNKVELTVLARYMQILSEDLCQKLSGKCINIHHSFLPSFKGARPYHQAHQRGVKIIGATAHYVTKDLDEGPIIEQETTRITHAQTPEEMIDIGQHLESLVLSRAVKAHVQNRILINGKKTVIFS